MRSTRSVFTVQRMMIAVAVVALACGGIVWIFQGARMEAYVKNSTGALITDVRISHHGTTRIVGDIPPGISHHLGRYSERWTLVAVSYTDARGKRMSSTLRYGVDLGRPMEETGDSGQAVIEIGPTTISSQRLYWVTW